MFIYLYSLILFSFYLPYSDCSCKFQNDKYDLSSLDRPSGWPVSGPTLNGTIFHYEISICRPLNFSSSVHEKGCPRSSVCLISNNSAVNYGNSVENTSDYAFAANIGTGFSLYVLTNTLCKTGGKYRAYINFICGSHLGSPELVLSSECQVNFMWRTSAACLNKPKNQVPCYVLDNNGDKRDLSPLIKTNEGYSVYTPNPAVDFIINVCSDLSFNSTNNKCSTNASACRIIGKEYYSFGSVSEGLKYTSEGLVLTYITSNASDKPEDCLLKPKTTIFFKCPKRGYSQPPKLISDSNCQYEVVWETEYACPENLLKGDLKSCQFTRESHGVEIDLSPLRNKTFNTTDMANNHYLISVCSGLGNVIKCGGKSWKSISVCVYNSSGSSQVGGKTDSAKFLYADGEIVLKYVKGATCNGTEQTSVINFKCDVNATNNGLGEPQHIASDTCTHIFEWHTKHACLKHSFDTPCSVTYDKKTVNLQKLLILDGESWEAIDGRTFQLTSQAEYFINVCGPIPKLGNNSMCGYGSAACVLNNKGEYLSLGNFTSPPIYDRVSDSVRLLYSGGSLCSENKFWQSSINFICKPGQISSKPILIRIDEIGCHYEFEWQTADACPTGLIEGSDCKVINTNLDIHFDLNPLKSKVYKVNSPFYEFYLGICEPVKDTPCNLDKDSTNNIGVCLVNKSNRTTLKTGEPTSHLTYTDGVVNLTYLSGDPYYNQNHTERITIIIFICDFTAGNGNPRFIEVEDFAFVFHWYTSLVCPKAVSTECIVHDPFSHDTYDLSGLALVEKNWKTYVNEDDNKERQMYLNVCQSLTFPITGCDPSAAACLVEQGNNGEETVVVPNLGRAINSPVLQSAGHIILRYTDGSPCTSYGKNTTYITVIHFLCDVEDSFQYGLKFLSKVGSCEYSFLWATKAACPTGRLHSENCQLTDPDSGFTFDLTPLHKIKEPYVVPSPSGGNFQFNICGKVNHGCFTSDENKQNKNISVCEVDSTDNLTSILASSNNFVLSYSPGRDLTLTYKLNSEIENHEVIIYFPCINSSSPTDPKLLHYESGQHIFELKTPLTCLPKPFECNILDNFGHEYDFSSLAKNSNGNWEVSDFRTNYSHLKYHINFCRPLNKVSSYKCPGGASSACQTSFNDSESMGYDLGSQMVDPIIKPNGTVVFHYSGGSYCNNGSFRRSTTIILHCSSVEGEMKFLGETPECEYLFSLETPVACPLESSYGKNCLVKEPIFGYTFNLNPLKNKNNNYNVTEGEFTYVFNVCDRLNNFDNKCANSSACQLKPNDPKFSKSLGLPNDVLIYRKGLITLEYKSGSGSCHGKYNRTTKITFLCHHAHEDRDGPIFVTEAEDCTYLFDWPTVHACPPFDVIECSVVDDKGFYYDLSKLSLPNDNYYIKYPAETNKTFVINVCRSVVHTPDSLCPYASAACLINSAKFESVNLGSVSRAPYFDNGTIKINYVTGDPCDEEGIQSARFMQTIIEFTCDPSLIDSEPEFIGKDSCTYYFDWPTAYACPPKTIETEGDCTVKDPITGYVYNFSSLRNQDIFKHKSGDHQYFLNICNSNRSTPCGGSVGMCQEELSGEKRRWNGGKLNFNLTYSNGILFLNYTDGDSCHKGQFQRNTLIEFHCGEGINEPQFLYESHDCTYFFSWKTELACQVHKHCAIKNGSLYYDLISLAESHHIAASAIENDNASYYISVCNSLEEIAGVYCPPGAAICRISRDSTSSSNVAESLGKMEFPPFVDFMDHPTIIYTNGSTCLKNPDYLNRARIIFLCEASAEISEPVLIDISDDCLYLFEWHTNLVCPDKPEVQPSFTSCNYSDNSRGIHFDLLPLKKTGAKPYYEVFDGEMMTFKLNICSDMKGNLSKCADTGVCGQSGNIFFNYGNAASQKFTYSGGRLRLTFYDGDDCPSGMNGKRTSEIFFVCDQSAGIGEPTLHKRYTCLVLFMWKTSLVCQNVQRHCAFDIAGQHYDFNLLSSLSHNWISTDANNITYWINICRGIQPTEDSFGCSPTSAICMMNRKGYHYSLGTLQSMQVEAKNSTDLILTFKNGDSRACFSINPASTLTPVTRLFMRCGRSLGHPQIFSGPDSKCYYDFVWESSLACTDKKGDVLIENDGIIKDQRLGFSFDIRDILNQTFTVPGKSKNDRYVYKINLSGGVSSNTSDPNSTCFKAAVCQTKNETYFERDIGSFDTRTFIVRGSELHLVFISSTRPCGKNRSKNVTSLINMQCSSAVGIGSPEFVYESGDCDYLFEWRTIVVCPDYHRRKSVPDIVPEPKIYVSVPESHHNAEIVIGVIFGIFAAMFIVFLIVKPERRAIISSRFRSLFGRVNLPYFRYKRCEGEKLVLVDASRTIYDDDEMLHC